MGFPGSSASKESFCNAEDPGSIPRLGRSPGEGIGYPIPYSCPFLVAQRLKRLPAMRKTRARSLGWEDPLEKEMAIHSGILAWRIPWMEEPGGLQSTGSWRVGHDWATSLPFSLSCIGEGNDNPLHCSCQENPRDRGAWWAAIYGVAQSRTWVKQLSSSSSGTTMVVIIHLPKLIDSTTPRVYCNINYGWWWCVNVGLVIVIDLLFWRRMLIIR